jgi:hypothetical protein
MMERPSEISLEEQRDIAVMERDVWKARAEAAESDAAETRAINGSLHAAMVRETVRADAAERELERHRHGVTIESDFVCPDSLALVNALGEAERLRAERDEWAGSAGRWCAAETAAIAEAERLRAQYERKCHDCGTVEKASYPWYDYSGDGRRVVCVVCCPVELKDTRELRAEADRLRAERDEWAGSAGRWCAAETAAIAEAERLRNLVLAMVEYKDGRDAGRPKDEGFVRAWLDTARALAAAGKEGG